MKLGNYIIDKIFSIFLILFCYFIILLLLLTFQVMFSLIIAITFVFFSMVFSLFFIDYFRKRKFYNEFIHHVNLLDKKYLVLETISKPTFYEGEILYQILYEINKSMAENVKKNRKEVEDFKEYIEMWIHEVKIPISSLTLLCHNHKDRFNKTYLNQVKKLDNYIDQVLYYVRSNYTEEDFIIKKVSLEKVISKVLLKNKDDILENKIDIKVDLRGIEVYSDSKWLEFILNQIINNSIKYKKENIDSFIRISAKTMKDKVILSVLDNGIGIQKKDLNKVFRKSFTGENGRDKTKSTGMGLYIADKLCKKMGHVLEISSTHQESTELRIVFGKNNFYQVDK